MSVEQNAQHLHTNPHSHGIHRSKPNVRYSKKLERGIVSVLTGIIQNQGHKFLAVNGMPDHVHIFFGMRPTQALSDLMQAVKGDSSKWINDKQLIGCRFSWQEGYGAFSYSKSHVPAVIRYVQNQEQHHRTKTFIEEYHGLLRKFDVKFEERYSFVPIQYEIQNDE